MKKMFGVFILGMILVSMMGIVVGETAEEAGEVAAENLKEVTSGVTAFFEALFADTIIGDEILSRIFMAVLLAMFIYTAIGSFFKGSPPWIHWSATIAVTALALIGLPDGFLESIRTGYGAMGAAILSVIPFLVIFWFTIMVDSYLIARITWLFFTLYYFALYISNVLSGTVGGRLIYLLAGIGGFIAFFFILQVRRFIWHGKMESIREKGMDKAKKRRTLLATEMERLKADETEHRRVLEG